MLSTGVSTSLKACVSGSVYSLKAWKPTKPAESRRTEKERDCLIGKRILTADLNELRSEGPEGRSEEPMLMGVC